MDSIALPAVCVVSRRAGRALQAGRVFEPRETILVADGVIRAAPARHSLQVGPEEHLDAPRDALPDDHLWRYLNHACRPNAAFHGRELIALRRIERREEITFDYETTEWELVSPFPCSCGGAGCTGRSIRGFRHLRSVERRRRSSQLREDLRRLVDGPPGPSPT